IHRPHPRDGGLRPGRGRAAALAGGGTHEERGHRAGAPGPARRAEEDPPGPAAGRPRAGMVQGLPAGGPATALMVHNRGQCRPQAPGELMRRIAILLMCAAGAAWAADAPVAPPKPGLSVNGKPLAPLPVAKDQLALLKSSDPKLARNKKHVFDFWRIVYEGG